MLQYITKFYLFLFPCITFKKNNKYIINNLLGTGGFSNIFIGFSTLLNKHVAIKSINLKHTKELRVDNEINIMKILNDNNGHKNILEIYDDFDNTQNKIEVINDFDNTQNKI